jgi:dihydrolipoamide dehydrogenase
MDRLLPFMDPDISTYAKNIMEGMGIDIILSRKATALSSSAKGIRLGLQPSSGSHAGDTGTLDIDRVFVVTGRKPNTAGLGLDAVGVSTSKGWIDVNMAMRTSVDNIYAAGDVNGIKLLAHAAFHQGIIAVENMLGAQKIFEPLLVPSVVYSRPPVSQVGMDERSAREAGMDVKTGTFEFANSPMALVHGEPSGFIKIISDKKYGRVLGASIAGESAYELVSLFTSGIAGEITVDELRRAVFAHPSFSEAVAEAAWAVDGLSQHTIKKGVL